MTEQDENVPLSKTQIKKQMDELQDLGLELTKLSADVLKKMNLPEDLLTAVIQHKQITANGALKRQIQYIGRLMRDVDPEPIENFLARLRGDNVAYNAFLQRIELWREKLLESDQALSGFIEEYPQTDSASLRTHIRNARKEKEQNKPPKAFRTVFQLLKNIMEDKPDA